MVCIPMADTKMRSLNVSTAVAVALYEVVRQRRTGRRATDFRAGPPKGGA
jgi:tRNA(Leu) C34 or U34 (ribose-2'-O)-methylase TrmL